MKPLLTASIAGTTVLAYINTSTYIEQSIFGLNDSQFFVLHYILLLVLYPIFSWINTKMGG